MDWGQDGTPYDEDRYLQALAPTRLTARGVSAGHCGCPLSLLCIAVETNRAPPLDRTTQMAALRVLLGFQAVETSSLETPKLYDAQGASADPESGAAVVPRQVPTRTPNSTWAFHCSPRRRSTT